MRVYNKTLRSPGNSDDLNRMTQISILLSLKYPDKLVAYNLFILIFILNPKFARIKSVVTREASRQLQILISQASKMCIGNLIVANERSKVVTKILTMTRRRSIL